MVAIPPHIPSSILISHASHLTIPTLLFPINTFNHHLPSPLLWIPHLVADVVDY